jgi:hypothetical protein
MEKTMSNVNVTNVLDLTAYDLSLWISNELQAIKVPRPGPNHTLNVQVEVLPVMADLANLQLLLTELYVIVVGATPTQTSLKTAGAPVVAGAATVKEIAEVLGRKKDILYRALQTTEQVRETASRMITGSQTPRNPY